MRCWSSTSQQDWPCTAVPGVSFGVIEQLRAAYPDFKFLELVHRLDKETSGLLMLAKKRSVLVTLHGACRLGQMDKRYYALLQKAS